MLSSALIKCWPKRNSIFANRNPDTGKDGAPAQASAPFFYQDGAMKLNYKQIESLWAYIFISPVVFGLLIFVAFPLIFGLWTSFTNWDALTPPQFIGFDNYIRLFRMTQPVSFAQILLNTLFFVLMAPVGIVVALILGLLAHAKLRLSKAFRFLFFLPTITSVAVITIVWKWMYNTNFGLINWLLSLVNIAPIPWLQSETWASLAIWIVMTWQGAGYGMMIVLVALQGINPEILEAATVDGAGALQRFWSITLPLLTPVLFFMLVTSVIGAFQLFGPVYMMMDNQHMGAGGLTNAYNTTTAVVFIHHFAFKKGMWAFSSAASYVLATIIFVFTFIQFKFQKKWVYYESEK
jgi:multiple sugar transport system permease protein